MPHRQSAAEREEELGGSKYARCSANLHISFTDEMSVGHEMNFLSRRTQFTTLNLHKYYRRGVALKHYRLPEMMQNTHSSDATKYKD